MRKFLEKVRKDDWNEILYYLMNFIKNDFKITDVINYLNEDFKLTESINVKDAERFIQIYKNLHNSTKLWLDSNRFINLRTKSINIAMEDKFTSNRYYDLF